MEDFALRLSLLTTTITCYALIELHNFRISQTDFDILGIICLDSDIGFDSDIGLYTVAVRVKKPVRSLIVKILLNICSLQASGYYKKFLFMIQLTSMQNVLDATNG